METTTRSDQRARLVLELGSGRRSTVLVGPGARSALGEVWPAGRDQAAVIGDANVLALYGGELVARLGPLAREVALLPFPPGEAHKTRETKARLEDELLSRGFVRRRVCVVACGGGISLDLAGFVAATYMRGVPWVSLPTSLLAQVDAAVGGKTGVNTDRGKNLVGAFHQPAAVLVDPELLRTLPPAEWGCGLAELVKHAVIADEALFDWIEAHAEELARPASALEAYPLRRSVEIKAGIVERDELEHGLRAVLNFGHTVGHALEKATRPALDHGRAVAIGMGVEGRLACALRGFPVEAQLRLEGCLARLGLPTAPPSLPFTELAPFLTLDKKRQDAQLAIALPDRLGTLAGPAGPYTVPVSLPALERAFAGDRP